MLGAVIAAALKAIGDFVLALLARTAADDAREAKGRAEAALDLQSTISEAADAQAQVNAADRGTSGSVLERLRERNKRGGAA